MRVHTQVLPLSRIVNTGIWVSRLMLDFRATDVVCGHDHLDPADAFVCRRLMKQAWEAAVAYPDFTIVEVGEGKYEARWKQGTDGRYHRLHQFKWVDFE